MRFVVLLEPDHDVGGFNVVVPALPGCFTQGETVEECLSRAQDAIATYLEGETRESLRAAGVDPDLIVDMVEVQTPVLM
jgi:antitoxin HicB